MPVHAQSPLQRALEGTTALTSVSTNGRPAPMPPAAAAAAEEEEEEEEASRGWRARLHRRRRPWSVCGHSRGTPSDHGWSRRFSSPRRVAGGGRHFRDASETLFRDTSETLPRAAPLSLSRRTPPRTHTHTHTHTHLPPSRSTLALLSSPHFLTLLRCRTSRRTPAPPARRGHG